MSTRARWREHVRAWRSSGDTAADYSGRAGLNPRTLSWWAWKLGPEAKPAVTTEPKTSFVEFAPLELASSGSFELELGSVVVRVPFEFEADALERLLDTLEARR